MWTKDKEKQGIILADKNRWHMITICSPGDMGREVWMLWMTALSVDPSNCSLITETYRRGYALIRIFTQVKVGLKCWICGREKWKPKNHAVNFVQGNPQMKLSLALFVPVFPVGTNSNWQNFKSYKLPPLQNIKQTSILWIVYRIAAFSPALAQSSDQSMNVEK